MMNRFLGTIGLLLVMVGCGSGGTSLEREINELPDQWSAEWKSGASSNNYAMLSRVISLTNVQERIRLTCALRRHFWKSPEWYVSRRLGIHGEDARLLFMDGCASRLIFGDNVTAESVLAGWKMRAEILDDLERIMELSAGDVGGADIEKSNFAYRVRRKYELFFSHRLSDCIGSYNALPSECRPSFVEQIKRDFFGRKGMEKVDIHSLPKAFWE